LEAEVLKRPAQAADSAGTGVEKKEPEMSAGVRRAAVIGAALTAIVVCAGTAAGAPTSSAPLPGLPSLALAPTDFAAGAKVGLQRSYTVEQKPAFMRVFKPGARIGARPLLEVVSQVTLYPDADGAAADLSTLRQVTRTKPGRQVLAKAFTAGVVGSAGKKKPVKKTTTVVGAPVSLGPSSLRLPITVTTGATRIRLAIVFMQVDRATETLVLVAQVGRALAASDATRAAAAADAHLRAAFTVASSAAPTVAGTAAQGQTLTADAGDWTGAPSSFEYAWSRCDASGNGCAAIDGATAASYTVGPADAGSTLRAVVTASNTVATQQAASVPTAPVT
jgi:hypothetical protein